MGYKIDINYNDYFDTGTKKTIIESEKITITENVAPLSDTNTWIIDDSYLADQFGRWDYGTITIPWYVTHLVIQNVSSSYYPTFKFASRSDNSVVWIDIITSALFGKYNYSPSSRFSYAGDNRNVDFYFAIYGQSSMKATDSSTSSPKPTIDLPRVVFCYADYQNESYPKLSVFGGESNDAENPSGYAIKADRVINYCEPGAVNLHGGSGCSTEIVDARGGTGQLPIEEKTPVYSLYSNSIGIKAGDGGDSKYGKGGDAYTYRYLTEKTYKKYADAFYSIREASVGNGKYGSGVYIDI